MKVRVLGVVLALFLLVTLVGGIGATSMKMVDIPQLTKLSSHIVMGEVVGISSYFKNTLTNSGHIYNVLRVLYPKFISLAIRSVFYSFRPRFWW